MIPRGFMFLFSEYFWHRGSAYKCQNVRLHFYLYMKDAKADKEVRIELRRNEIIQMNL
jgi:hypothetical protein